MANGQLLKLVLKKGLKWAHKGFGKNVSIKGSKRLKMVKNIIEIKKGLTGRLIAHQDLLKIVGDHF